MIKNLALLLVSLSAAVPSFSQSPTPANVAKGTKPPSQTAGASLSADKLKVLTKAWALDTVEEFGVANPPSAKEKGDGITFVADGSLFITQEGTAATGTWKYAGGRLNVETKTPANKISFRLISLSDARMVLDYQTPELIRIKQTYKPKK